MASRRFFALEQKKTSLANFSGLSPNHDFRVGNSLDLVENLEITCGINF